MPDLRRAWFSASCVVILLLVGGCQSRRTPLRQPPQEATRRPAPAPEPTSSRMEQLRALEDRRALSDGRLVQWAQRDPDPQVRARALLALARIQAPSTAPVIAQALTDSAAPARYEAAFAAGNLVFWRPLRDDVRDALVDQLLAAEARETDEEVRRAQLEALGKLASPQAVERLIERLQGAPAPVQARAALSLGVAARRGGVIPEKLVPAAAPLLGADPASAFGAAYALSWSKLAAARPSLRSCASADSGEVRLLCARGLGEIGTDADVGVLQKLLDDPDYRVGVEATRALVKLSERCKRASCPALTALTGLSVQVDRLARGDLPPGAQPLLALAQQGLPPVGRKLLSTLRAKVIAAEARAQPPLRADLANIDCRLAAALDRQTGRLQAVHDCGGGLVGEVRRLSLGLGAIASAPAAKNPAQRANEFARYLAHPDARVKAAALEGIASTKSASAAERIRALVHADDLLLAIAAADAAARTGDTGAIPAIRELAVRVAKESPQDGPPVAEALSALKARDAEPELRAWLNHPHRALRIAAAEALTQLSGQRVEVPDVDGPALAFTPPELPNKPTLLIQTEKGDITLKLYDDAPLTAGNLYQLAQKGFFRNLTFHRVVPDFVVQGGDPRGDGNGGPGYAIPCENNHHPYVRGVVGMALGGPDTGGSQLFITHSPQPHLDGRYTAFGEVTSGMDVVDRLLEGDRIVDIRAQALRVAY